LVDVKKLLALPDGHYVPGKIHTQLTMGKDGNIYFGTHRGSTTTTTEKYYYKGDWIIRVSPATGKSEVVVHGPVAKHCIPTGFLDPDRLIFYGGTAPGEGKDENNGVRFFAYDVAQKKVLCDVADGPQRAMIFARSTGRVYYTQAVGGAFMRFDPATGGQPVKIPGEIGIRASSDETKAGIVYTVASGQGGREPVLYAFDTKTEKVTPLGSPLVGSERYITALKIDATGRYLYYIPGAHGGADRDGSAVVQYDTRTKTKKVIAFLHPFYREKYGVAPVGTYSYALSPDGADLYVTWNANRTGRAWDVCALSVIHIPKSERKTD
jgi:DNA-binding beta-propeller fold protein YncE